MSETALLWTVPMVAPVGARFDARTGCSPVGVAALERRSDAESDGAFMEASGPSSLKRQDLPKVLAFRFSFFYRLRAWIASCVFAARTSPGAKLSSSTDSLLSIRI